VVSILLDLLTCAQKASGNVGKTSSADCTPGYTPQRPIKNHVTWLLPWHGLALSKAVVGWERMGTAFPHLFHVLL